MFAWTWEEFKNSFHTWLPVSKLAQWHINTREFATIVAIIIVKFNAWKASRFSFSALAGKLIVVDTDNVTAKHYANTRYGHSELLSSMAATLEKYLSFLKSALLALHRAGLDNVVADALSRDSWVLKDFTWSWSLSDRHFGTIKTLLGLDRFQWDLMASLENKKGTNFVSEYEDLFTIDLRLKLGPVAVGWLFPPTTLAKQTIKWVNKWVALAPPHRKIKLVVLVNSQFVNTKDLDSWYKICALKQEKNAFKVCEESEKVPLFEPLAAKVETGLWMAFASYNFKKRNNEEASASSSKKSKNDQN